MTKVKVSEYTVFWPDGEVWHDVSESSAKEYEKRGARIEVCREIEIEPARCQSPEQRDTLIRMDEMTGNN